MRDHNATASPPPHHWMSSRTGDGYGSTQYSYGDMSDGHGGGFGWLDGDGFGNHVSEDSSSGDGGPDA